MTTLEDAVSQPMEENSVITDQPEPAEKPMKHVVKPSVKSKKQPSYRQKLQTLQARIKYREKAIKGLRHHLTKGTFPKRFKSLRPYPMMETPESQVIVNATCQQVECVILEQMALNEEIKFKEDQTTYQMMKEERKGELSQVPRKPKMITAIDVMRELAELQLKYDKLCSKLDSSQ